VERLHAIDPRQTLPMHLSRVVAALPSLQTVLSAATEHVSRQHAATVQLVPGIQMAVLRRSVLGATEHATLAACKRVVHGLGTIVTHARLVSYAVGT
jgi:hypothetical protein